jgi:hypothetical protein
MMIVYMDNIVLLIILCVNMKKLSVLLQVKSFFPVLDSVIVVNLVVVLSYMEVIVFLLVLKLIMLILTFKNVLNVILLV